MEKISLNHIASAVSGQILFGQDLLRREIDYIDTDSRNIHENSLFVPIVGDRFDGHSYLETALSAGALACLTDRPLERYHEGHCYILVKDTKIALGDLARWYKSRFDIPCVAITGSVGKTTTKDMVASVLATKYKVLKTEGNFNNDIGLPLTIFRLDSHHEICVLEMGMSGLGEIDYLASIAKPEIAVITNIGDAHIECLGSREGIFQAKCEVLPHLKSEGMLLVNGDDEMLKGLLGTIPQPVIPFGGDESLPYHATQPQNLDNGHIGFAVTTPKMYRQIELPAMGNHMIYPTLTAVAIGEKLGLTPDQIDSGIRSFIPTRMRMNILRFDHNITILDDSYNANPQSMRAAIQVLSDSGNQKKIAVLGDMFELGSYASTLHAGVGEAVGTADIQCLVAVGEQSIHMADSARKSETLEVYHVATRQEAEPILADLMEENTIFLVKASRGMAMEHLTAHLATCAENFG